MNAKTTQQIEVIQKLVKNLYADQIELDDLNANISELNNKKVNLVEKINTSKDNLNKEHNKLSELLVKDK
jgi:peptidoglycan hydrolase CwlO-like protein